MDFLNNIEGLTDEQKAAIETQAKEALKTSTEAAQAELKAQNESLLSQIQGLEGVKEKTKAELMEKEEALAKASGDYSKVIETKEAEFNEKLAQERARANTLLKEKFESAAAVDKQKLISVFADSSKELAALAANSLVRTTVNEQGEYSIAYTMPDGSSVESADALIEAVKKSDQFKAMIKAPTAQGGGNPPGQAGFNGRQVDMGNKKERQEAIKQKFNLSS